jgi:Nin one binding (NOB1) Zn-ribbon like
VCKAGSFCIVPQDMEKVFCAKCGNATLEKVELVVNANGMEQYGVRKKHNLRGTRFPLPKPKVRHGAAQLLLYHNLLVPKELDLMYILFQLS